MARALATSLASAVAAILTLVAVADTPPHSLTQDEIARIVALGPWPAPWRPDASNRVSDNPDAIQLGRLLFFDARLSPGGTHACSSCHRPERAWTDGRATAVGLEPSRRNTLSLLDVRYRRAFGWDGAADSLWAQSLRPILDPREMGSSAEHIRRHIADDADLAALYTNIFGRSVAQGLAEDVLVDVAKALAAFQETIISPDSALDELRHALADGSTPRRDRWSDPAIQGLRIFIGKGECTACHRGPTLGSDEFHAVVTLRSPEADPGRIAGIGSLARSAYTLASRFSDARVHADHKKIEPAEGDRGAFRVPTLRGVKATAPYLHDGTAATLADAIARHDNSASGVPPLSAGEIAALVAFLETL